MATLPFLSIIIAAHNCEKTIDDTFDSLINALGPAISESEIIIIDDGSEDSTAQKISSFAEKFSQVIISTVNYKNIGMVRQHGVSLSQGKYITMLDSDDIIKAETLTPIFTFLHDVKPDMLLTRLHEIRDLNKINHQWSGLKPEKISQNEAITRFLIHKDLQAHLIGQFIKRDIYIENKIPPMTCYEDFYIFPKMLTQATNIYFQFDSHYYYIKRQGSLSTSLDHDKIKNLLTCTIKMEDDLPVKFRHLILCHWLDIYLKHYDSLTENDHRSIVKKHVVMTHSLGFFLNRHVRFSYKRKALSTLWKN
ncbi:glycosyltransferase involved in cell wall biosynthesis [Buttiauxella sp. BIGb0552]|uniref:glycosyltransferase family 2 protein n=1 Tax=Buttiauxella sp. BIGb0552 TaxID=2485120 RepID=UPI001064C197|nr:glycosyltransferase [Buttiauxella sp. BIGb0552]TDX10996.1 glycosyltransferase involved in cell wall biosynthesis [Buttiauxella sp. BIGb0552]